MSVPLVGNAGLYVSDDAEPQYAANGVLGVGSPTILFDGKVLNLDDTNELWDNVGTGTFTFQQNKSLMEVTAGEYTIRQSRRTMPYYAGYPMQVETTCDNFHSEPGVEKMVGYFSSAVTAPYSASLDGFALVDDGERKRLRVWNNGTLVFDVPEEQFLGRSKITRRNRDYDWQNFNVILFDFLWLGGAALRVWLRVGDRWQLLHAVAITGTRQDVIFQSPQQFVRYEMRSTTGTGSFRPICSQVSVVGDVGANGFLRSDFAPTSVSANVIDTTYVLMALRKQAAARDTAIELVSAAMARSATQTDVGILSLQRNPTLSAPLTYDDIGKLDRAYGAGETVTARGDVLMSAPASDLAQGVVDGNYSRWLTQSLDDTFDEYVLCYTALSINQSVRGIMTWKEHG